FFRAFWCRPVTNPMLALGSERRPQPAQETTLLRTGRHGLFLRTRHRPEAHALTGLAELLGPVAHEADARRVLRSLHELHDPLHAHGEAHAHRHPQDLFGALDHALHEHGTAGEHAAGADLFEQTRLFDASPGFGEDLLDARLDDVAEQTSRHAARGMAAHAGHLDLFVVGDHAAESAAVVALQTLGLRHGGAEPGRDVVGDVVSAGGNGARVHDAAVRIQEDVRGATADVDDR